MAYVKNNIEFEDARIMFKNFRGRPTKFKPNGGSRNFCVAIPDAELATALANDGWNIRVLAPRDEDDMPLNYLQVEVNYGGYNPPHVYTFANGVRTELDEDTIGELDTADIESVDLVVRPYNWEVNGRAGVKAYLKTAYVTLNLDRFAQKYAAQEHPTDTYDDEGLPF